MAKNRNKKVLNKIKTINAHYILAKNVINFLVDIDM